MALSAPEMKKSPTPKEIVIEWIDHILDRKKWTGTDLARHSEIAPSTILRLINNPKHPFIPTLSTLQKIAKGSGYPIPKRVMAALGGPEDADVSTDDDREPSTLRRVNLRMPQRQPTVELRHVSSLPAALQSAASPRREGYVPAPAQLEGDETAFAFHMPDNSFGMWFKSGGLMYASKRRDPVPGDMVVITDKNEKTRVRLLMDITEKGLKLSKSMPEKEDETMDFEEVKEIAIVVVTVRPI
ncbi:helix-turn-helix transcriptional regulator [Bradyrhizobium sp. th.b2]|uniref:XRE family transcriptional regulator n=1 Tax=Bradyrhizobium sp. th-b2 TaxID=172088 RepID=UPI0012EB6620|nr:helix-turn-helix transcriptional regulator [Bradyrhizobium sp. th.b2]